MKKNWWFALPVVMVVVATGLFTQNALATPQGTVDYAVVTPTVTVFAQGRDIQAPVVGQSVLFGSKFAANSPQLVSPLFFACRTPTGANCDFGWRSNVTIPTAVYTLTGSKTFTTPGTYEVWVAYSQNNTWFNLLPKMSVTVS